MLIYFTFSSLCPLTLYSYLSFPSFSYSNHVFILYVCESVFYKWVICIIFLDTTYKWYHMMFSLSDLIHLVWYFLCQSMFLQMAIFYSFYVWVIVHCVCMCVCVYKYMYVFVCTYVSIYVCVCVCVYIYTSYIVYEVYILLNHHLLMANWVVSMSLLL